MVQKSLDFVRIGAIKKMQVYQHQIDADIRTPVSNFIKNETLAQVFPCTFCKIIKNTYFAQHLRRAASNDMIIARFFYKIYCSLKWKIKGYQ